VNIRNQQSTSAAATKKTPTLSALAEICIGVLAHNEEGRIAICMNSLPLGEPDVAIHIIINGSTDRTADIAKRIAAAYDNVTVHVLPEGGKSRSWNRFVFDLLPHPYPFHIFVDGDAELLAGSVGAMVEELNGPDKPNAVSGMPANGRRVDYYQQMIRDDRGMFGDLYGLSGDFLSRMKAAAIRLPVDLIGDDGLICAMAKTNLGNEDDWQDARVAVSEDSGFLCEPVKLSNPASWRLQYRRMISYSIRHFQNQIITGIMRGPGPSGFPNSLAELYAGELPKFAPRNSFPEFWFDRIALKRMAKASA
jgi:glycosyltransferase involved in cell wall biosynthesis